MSGFYYNRIFSAIMLFSLEQWAQIAAIVTSVSVVVAVAALIYQQRTDRRKAVAQQIGFFREKVLTLSYPLLNEVEELSKQIDLEWSQIENIEELSVNWLFKHRSKETILQYMLWRAVRDIHHKDIRVDELLNALEQLSAEIKAFGIVKEPELISIRGAFVTIIELCTWPLVLTSPYNKESYPALRYVYGKWRDRVDRIPVEETNARIKQDINEAKGVLLETLPASEYGEVSERVEKEIQKIKDNLTTKNE